MNADFSSASSTPIRPGTILGGRFRVDRLLGRGGFGVVFAATHLTLDRRVALKVLLPHLLNDGETASRFLREARAAVSIRSPHVVDVLDAGELETGEPYMAMELLEGVELEKVLKTRGPLLVHEAVDYALQICEGLAAAHARSIVHRDLKPANLFLTTEPDGATFVKVLDFGICKAPHDVASTLPLSTAKTMGTPVYMSPEQLRSTRWVDARADIWSLGVVLYEMLEGRRPFHGDTVVMLFESIQAERVPPLSRPDLPAGLASVVERCLCKTPAERYADVAALAESLAPFSTYGKTRAATVARILNRARASNPDDCEQLATRAISLGIGNQGGPPPRQPSNTATEISGRAHLSARPPSRRPGSNPSPVMVATVSPRQRRPKALLQRRQIIGLTAAAGLAVVMAAWIAVRREPSAGLRDRALPRIEPAFSIDGVVSAAPILGNRLVRDGPSPAPAGVSPAHSLHETHATPQRAAAPALRAPTQPRSNVPPQTRGVRASAPKNTPSFDAPVASPSLSASKPALPLDPFTRAQWRDVLDVKEGR